MDILEELWLGQIAPIEQAFPKTEEHRQARHQVEKCRQVLESMLPQEGQIVLASYGDAEIQMRDYSEREAFAQGFRLGARLMLAIQKTE